MESARGHFVDNEESGIHEGKLLHELKVLPDLRIAATMSRILSTYAVFGADYRRPNIPKVLPFPTRFFRVGLDTLMSLVLRTCRVPGESEAERCRS